MKVIVFKIWECGSGRHTQWELANNWGKSSPLNPDFKGLGGVGWYQADTYRECAAKARADGWRVSRIDRLVMCPYCNPESKHYKESL